jgi:hypothetical protein
MTETLATEVERLRELLYDIGDHVADLTGRLARLESQQAAQPEPKATRLPLIHTPDGAA